MPRSRHTFGARIELDFAAAGHIMGEVRKTSPAGTVTRHTSPMINDATLALTDDGIPVDNI